MTLVVGFLASLGPHIEEPSDTQLYVEQLRDDVRSAVLSFGSSIFATGVWP